MNAVNLLSRLREHNLRVGGGGGTRLGLSAPQTNPLPQSTSPVESQNTKNVEKENEFTKKVNNSPMHVYGPGHPFYRANKAREILKKVDAATDAAQLRMRLQDKKWRMMNLYLIENENKQVVPFKPRYEQREFMRNMHNRNFVPKARKLGMSTYLVLNSLDDCIFPSQEMAETDEETTIPGQPPKRSVRAGIIDLKETDAWEKLAIARLAWEKGPGHPDKHIAAIWEAIHRNNPLVKDSNGLMAWTNGSAMQAGVSYTGKTPQILHVSEFGPIAAQFPKVADNILRGSINAVPTNGMVHVETTMEGRFGECYKLFKLAVASAATQTKDMTPLDWRLHFFSWLRHPSYILKGRKPQGEATRQYFAELTQKHGAMLEEEYGYPGGVVPDERQAWWEKKRMEQGDHMWTQFPTVLEEVDRAQVAGQIYPEMLQLRVDGRIKEFAPERSLPLFIACDLGSSDNSAAWLVQPAGKFDNFLRCAFGEGKGAAGIAGLWRAWSAEFPEHHIEQILLPHDAEITDKGSGLTYKQSLINAGVPSRVISVVPRTPDVWVGIELVRDMLPHTWFHSVCDQPTRDADGGELPSGVARLEGYRRQPPSATGVLKAAPLGDICSHASDALRTYAEGKQHGRVRSTQKSVTGISSGDAPRAFKVVMA